MYVFPDSLRSAYEALPVPLVFDQYIDGKVVPLLMSDGFCRLVGMDRAKAMAWFTRGQFERLHPDDAGNVARVSEEFARRRGNYDVIFRSRHADGYHFIHAAGWWVSMPDGTELAVLTYEDVSEHRDEILRLSEHYLLFQKDRFYSDKVTGLPNVNYMHEFADDFVHRLHVEGRTPMLLYVDVNFMQSYNNQYGFARGDDLLRLVAAVLSEAFEGALVSRGAEDHFVLIDECTDEAAVSAKIEAANARIRREAYGNTTGIQAGICLFEPDMGAADAISHARSALKLIKSDLNETHRFYSRGDDLHYWNRRYIVENIDRALEQSWVRVYYQGITRLETGKCAVLEALARWIDPNRGVISPGEFIPVLRKYHLLYKLDLYMMEQVCREIELRVEAGLPLLPVSINFSAQDFDYADIPSALNAIYERYDVARHAGRDLFIIEITEQDMATATEHFHEQLRRLRRDGYRLWLDDFGSGYSSLNVFSRFRFDLIKFDMELVRNLDDHDGANRRILKAMIGLARDLGVHTLAEGMETESQRRFLQESGCELAQGFLFHRPESLDSILYRNRNGNTSGPCETPEERAALIQKWLKA